MGDMDGVGTRFEMELELMNCLASPEYLHCEPAFLPNILRDLNPWSLRTFFPY